MPIKDCCKNPENLVTQALDPERVVSVCRVCGCRHFRMKADPGRIGLQGSGMGA